MCTRESFGGESFHAEPDKVQSLRSEAYGVRRRLLRAENYTSLVKIHFYYATQATSGEDLIMMAAGARGGGDKDKKKAVASAGAGQLVFNIYIKHLRLC